MNHGIGPREVGRDVAEPPVADSSGHRFPPAPVRALTSAFTPSARPARRLPEWGAVVLLCTSVVAVSLPVAVASGGGIYLPPDGAHYLADADALAGNGVRELLHLPLFPSLVLVSGLVTGGVAGFALAIALALAATTAALYLLLRTWLPLGPALVGAGAGILQPTTAELLGWGGGATLLGIAGLVLTLYSMEAWIARGGRRGWLVGVALGLTCLTHPFPFAVAVACVAVRWVLLAARREWQPDAWGPCSLLGFASAAAPVLPGVVLALPYLLGVESGVSVALQLPDPARMARFLSWALGGGVLPWLLLAAAVLGTVMASSTGAIAYACVTAVVILVMGSAVGADSSYLTRALYLLSLIVALGMGSVAERVAYGLRSIGGLVRRPRTAATVAATGLLTALAVFGFGPRMTQAASFYQVIGARDVRALEGLRGGTGIVAASWNANQYGLGVTNSWFVEGIARRRSVGPADPRYTNVAEQRETGREMQRLFFGMEGVENGALQIGAGVPGMRADPAIQVSSEGFYQPLLFGNVLVNGYPVQLSRDRSERIVEGDTITWRFYDDNGRTTLLQKARLEGRTVEIRSELAPRIRRPGDWSLWYWPAYGTRWSDISSETSRFSARVERFRQGSWQNEPVTWFELLTDADSIAYRPVEDRFNVEAIEVSKHDSRSLTVTIGVDGSAAPSTISRFGEREILERNDITNVVLWRDTGWRERFEFSPCYERTDESEELLVYAADPLACSRNRPSVR